MNTHLHADHPFSLVKPPLRFNTAAYLTIHLLKDIPAATGRQSPKTAAILILAANALSDRQECWSYRSKSVIVGRLDQPMAPKLGWTYMIPQTIVGVT